jgi:sugar phosphate permease
MLPDTEVERRLAKATHARHYVLGMAFAASFIMYADRVCISAATPAIMKEFGISKITMGWILSAFSWSYALFQVPAGWLADRFGSRIVLAAAMALWSAFTVATGASVNGTWLAITRLLFGAGEAGAFPACSRALALWLPIKQRAFGQGFQHSGSRFGAALTPPVVVFLMRIMTWQQVFFVFGSVGIFAALGWYWYYRDDPAQHSGVNEQELAVIGQAARQTAARSSVPWRLILASSDLWFLSSSYFCYGWVLWMYLTWFPTYLVEERHFSSLRMGLAASIPLLGAAVSNAVGGLVSDKLTPRLGLRRARLTVSVVGYIVAGTGLLAGTLISDSLEAMICLTAALAGLELTVGVSWAMSVDIGREVSGSVSSVMNTFGNIGGALAAGVSGYLAAVYGWSWPFIAAAGLCAVAAVLVVRVNPAVSVTASKL